MQASTVVKGDFNLAYETKVIIQAMAEILLQTNDVEKAYNALKRMANTEGVILKAYEEAMAEIDPPKRENKKQ